MDLNKIIKIISCFFLIISNYSCSQTTKQANMMWIAKYSFYDFYKENINNGNFPPGAGLRLTIFKFLNEKTIFLAGSKDLHAFFNKPGDCAVLFVSKDKGKSYQEVTFSEENVTFLTTTEKYTLVETNINGYSAVGKNVIYLLDNTTLQFKKINEYSSNSKISYKQFNGEYVIYSVNNETYVLNMWTEEKYKLPNEVVEKNFILNDSDVTITFLRENNKVVLYNAKNNSYEVSKSLKGSYSTIMNTFGEITLGKENLLKTSGTIYDLNEKELFEATPKTEKGLYRYKNFASYFKETRPYVTFFYSYDYGKTWYEYKSQNIFTTAVPKGYYKDKYIVLDVSYYDKDNDADIIVGEFQK